MSILDDTQLPEDRLMAVFSCAASGSADAEPLDEGITLLVGPAEAGKADRLLAQARAAGSGVFFHHAGLGGESHDPTVFLWRLLSAIRRHCGFRDPVPSDPEVMREALPNWLARAAAAGPYAIVLAEAHELSRGGLEPSLDWLPGWLPAGVRIGLSTRPGPSAELLREHADRVVDQAAIGDLAEIRGRLRALMDAPPAGEILQWLWIARDGLSAADLAELTGQAVEDALLELAPFVRSDGQRWILASALVREVAASRSLADHGERQRMHQRLAERLATSADESAAVLRLWHLAAASRQDLLVEGLSTFGWLADMLQAGRRFEALRYWTRLGGSKPLADRLKARLARDGVDGPGSLGAARLLETAAGEPAPLAWLQQALALAVTGGDEVLQALCHERIGVHPDTPQAQRPGYLQEALAIRERLHGAGHALTEGVRHHLAVRHEEDGDLAAAMAVYQEGIRAIGQHGGETEPALIAWLSNLAGVRKATGELKEADQLISRALKLAREQLGARHPTTAGCCDQLAGVHYMSAQYETAEALFREALEITEGAFGPEHGATAACLNNLGTVLDARQQYAEAERLYRRALQVRLALHGEHHSDTASSLHNLATALEAAGKTAEAEQLFRRALDAWDKVSGQDSPAFATTLLGLADLLRDRGAWADAEALYRSDIEIWRQLVGSEHPHTLAALAGLARLYVQGDKPELAEPLLLHVCETAAEVVGKTDALYMEAAGLLAALLRDAGRKNEARSLLETALAAHSAQLAMLSAPAQKLRRLLDSLDTRPHQTH